MAQKTVVTVTCDLPHKEETEGAETVSFAFDGTGYEIDTCPDHAKDLREKFGKYTDHARRGTPSRTGRRGSRGVTQAHNTEIRAWAKDQGLKISDRGRIPADITAQYQAAH